jgi:hypothetical protein
LGGLAAAAAAAEKRIYSTMYVSYYYNNVTEKVSQLPDRSKKPANFQGVLRTGERKHKSRARNPFRCSRCRRRRRRQLLGRWAGCCRWQCNLEVELANGI